MAVDQRTMSLLGVAFAALLGRLDTHNVDGLHFERGDEIRIDSKRSSVVLDGEVFEANTLNPIVLRSTAPIPFLRLAA